MSAEGWSPTDVDLTTPNTARIYDYLLGGKDNYAADREVAEQLLTIIPEARMAARHNHAFAGRAVRHLVAAGVRQFINFPEPVGVMLDRVRHFVGDEGKAAEVTARLHAALAPGSHLVFTHVTQE